MTKDELECLWLDQKLSISGYQVWGDDRDFCCETVKDFGEQVPNKVHGESSLYEVPALQVLDETWGYN